MLRRRHGSVIQLREPPIVKVPCTAGKPRNYHTRKKRVGSSFRLSHAHTTQQNSATQGTPSSSQLPSSTAAGAVGTNSIESSYHPKRCWIHAPLAEEECKLVLHLPQEPPPEPPSEPELNIQDPIVEMREKPPAGDDRLSA